MSKAEIDSNDLYMEWDLETLFGYGGYDDPKIEADVKKGIRQIKRFVKKYATNDEWLKDPKILKQALLDYEEESAATRPLVYLWLKSDLNLDNLEIRAKSERLSEEVSKVSETTIFFTLQLAKIDQTTQKKFLASKELESFRYFLKNIFDKAKHNLTEPEEKILSRVSSVAGSLWSDSLIKALNSKSIPFKGKDLSIGETYNLLKKSDSRKVRLELEKKLFAVLDSLGDLAEPVYNAVAKRRKINDELRGYKTPFQVSVEAYDNTVKEVQELVDTVEANYDIATKFFEEKRKFMGLDKLSYSDFVAPVGDIKGSYNINSSIEIVHNSLAKFDQGIADRLIDYFKKGQIDVYPRPGKRGGGYHLGGEGIFPNFILLNHTDNFDGLMTLAHEFGHATHSDLSNQSQRKMYRDYSTAVAETASTLFEHIVFYDLLPTLSEKEQAYALHMKLNDAITTTFRQIAGFSYELSVHNFVRENGYISHEQLKTMMNDHIKKYFGRAFDLDEIDGSFYVMWLNSHLYRPFYLYTYCYGELISMALYQIYKEDPEKGRHAARVFMSAGSSMKPRDIFKKAGIKVGPELWQRGLDQLRDDLLTLKKLHKKIKK